MATKDITDRQVCEAYAKYRVALDLELALRRRGICVDCPYPYDLLMQVTGQCFKVCYRAMERAANRGLVECGVSLRTGWLTPKGRALLVPNSTSG